jgi:two-component system chemotaxis response regulator CheY
MSAHKILIVDDSAITRAMIRRILTLCDVDPDAVFEAPDGAAALALLATQSVDLILADLHMPVMCGVELTTRIVADPALRHTPVVIVSADPNTDRLNQLKQIGARGFLPKPFTPEEFRDLLRVHLAPAA